MLPRPARIVRLYGLLAAVVGLVTVTSTLWYMGLHGWTATLTAPYGEGPIELVLLTCGVYAAGILTAHILQEEPSP